MRWWWWWWWWWLGMSLRGCRRIAVENAWQLTGRSMLNLSRVTGSKTAGALRNCAIGCSVANDVLLRRFYHCKCPCFPVNCSYCDALANWIVSRMLCLWGKRANRFVCGIFPAGRSLPFPWNHFFRAGGVWSERGTRRVLGNQRVRMPFQRFRNLRVLWNHLNRRCVRRGHCIIFNERTQAQSKATSEMISRDVVNSCAKTGLATRRKSICGAEQMQNCVWTTSLCTFQPKLFRFFIRNLLQSISVDQIHFQVCRCQFWALHFHLDNETMFPTTLLICKDARWLPNDFECVVSCLVASHFFFLSLVSSNGVVIQSYLISARAAEFLLLFVACQRYITWFLFLKRAGMIGSGTGSAGVATIQRSVLSDTCADTTRFEWQSSGFARVPSCGRDVFNTAVSKTNNLIGYQS